jgi:hypothetical protein
MKYPWNNRPARMRTQRESPMATKRQNSRMRDAQKLTGWINMVDDDNDNDDDVVDDDNDGGGGDGGGDGGGGVVMVVIPDTPCLQD